MLPRDTLKTHQFRVVSREVDQEHLQLEKLETNIIFKYKLMCSLHE